MKAEKRPAEVKNILIIKLSSIGDCLLATPAIESIRRGYPGSFITWLVEDKARDIALLNPHVDEVIVIDKKNFKAADYIGLIRRLRKRKYDLSIDLQGVDRTSVFAFLSGAPVRYVEEYADLGFLSNRKIIRKDRPLEHAVKFYLFLAENCGGEKITGPKLTMETSEEDGKFADRFLEKHFGGTAGERKIFVGINPGGAWKTKRWPLRYFTELSKRLIDSYGANITVFGGKGDESAAAEILNALNSPKAASSAGKTTLKQAKALLERMDYFITPDSGLMHIASAIGGLKTIALFGATDPELTGPVGLNCKVIKDNLICMPCFKKECPLNKIEKNNLKECVLCMKRIHPDTVFEAVRAGIENSGKAGTEGNDNNGDGLRRAAVCFAALAMTSAELDRNNG